MGQYRLGTISITNGSAAITVSGASAGAENVAVGQSFKVDRDGEVVYQIASRTPASGASITALTLSVVYGGVTGAGLNYQITQDYTPNRSYPELAQGDADAADWLTRAIRKIDTDMALLLGTSSVLNISTNQVAFWSSGLKGDANLTWVSGTLLTIAGQIIATSPDSIIAGFHTFRYGGNGHNVARFTHTGATTPHGPFIDFTAAAPNNATSYFFECDDTVGLKFKIYSNGGLANFQANDVNLSDERTKSIVEPYSPAFLDQLSDALERVNWGRYKYADQTHDDWNHGPTAQGVRAAFAQLAPELVGAWTADKSGDLIGIYTHDLSQIVAACMIHRTAQISIRLRQLEDRMAL